MATASDLPIDTSASAMDMAEAMFGTGITVTGASYQGAGRASGIYSQGDSTAPGVTPSDSGVILSTGRASDITNPSGDANTSPGTSTANDTSGDAGLSAISGQSTYDAAIFEAEFVPEGSTLTMQVVFSSEEYLEYVGSGFNDAVGIWVNGEQAELTVGSGGITINNINDESNSNLYLDNPASGETYNTEMDGLTVTLTLKAPVIPGEANSIRIGIADGGDRIYDSNLLIAGNSVQTALVAGDDAIGARPGQEVEADLLANDESAAGGTLSITAINNQPVEVGDTVVLASGEAITLTPTGIVLAAGAGEPGGNTFSYEVSDASGNTDIGFVTLTTTPCFVAGTLIDTPRGAVPVEALRPGDRVLTRDHGPQPLRWLGLSTRRATGPDAPVRIAAGALGANAALDLSPNHRVMIAAPAAELLFAETEVLVRARDLAGQPGIARRADGRALRYVHLLFDRHEIVRGGGLWSESYHPGPETMTGFDVEAEAELRRLFPELYEGMGPARYGPAARRVLRRYEAGLLVAAAPPGGPPAATPPAACGDQPMR
ncbi:choice-of-anchor L domain-containing protein [Roseovarius ramblicola]|uniref:Choice-of-anchor L domain-containing protein n=1 Tax=Roseovarius ramblicola TaxID=2022336 RepID=A0ABV5HZC8_9RHOB